MTAEELEKIVARHEGQCLELKESFNGECIETACAFLTDDGMSQVSLMLRDGRIWLTQKRIADL